MMANTAAASGFRFGGFEEQGPQVPPDFKLGGGTTAGQDPGFGLNLPPIMSGEKPDEFRFDKAAAGASNVGKQLGSMADRATSAKLMEKVNISFSPTTGMFKAEGPNELLQGLMKKAQQFDTIQGNYQKLLAENEQKIANIKAHPFANTLAHIAASFGANDPNPYTRSIAQAAVRLNPTEEQLKANQMEILQPYQQSVTQQTGLMERALAHQENTEMRRLALEQHKYGMRRQESEDTEKNIERFTKPFTELVKTKAGTLPKKEAFAAEFRKQVPGASDSRIESEYKELLMHERAASEGRATLRKEHEAQVETEFKGREKERRAIMRENLLPLARDLAAGDLTAIRQVSSVRTGERSMLYQLIKEIDPTYDTSKIDRKIEMQKQWDTGETKKDIVRFDTFLQHAGELSDALKDVKLSNVVAYNKGLNWWRKNMEASPEYARLKTAIEPVAKEYMNFLLGGRALYTDDRAAMRDLLEMDIAPAKLFASLNQMGKTAVDRYKAIEQPYIRLFGKAPDDPFSSAAHEAATKIGLRLSTDSPGGVSGGITYEGFQRWRRGRTKPRGSVPDTEQGGN